MTAPKKSTSVTNLTLDKALRYLLASILYLEVPLLAIRFEFNGETWEADTPDEAIALREKLEWSTRFPPNPAQEMDKMAKFWTSDRFMDVIEGIGELQRKLLLAIRRKPGITSNQLVKALGMKSEVALAGVLSGLSKQLKKMAVEPKDVFLIRIDWTGKRKTRSFLLDDFFIAAGAELNWPDAWEDAKHTERIRSKTLAGNDPGVGD